MFESTILTTLTSDSDIDDRIKFLCELASAANIMETEQELRNYMEENGATNILKIGKCLFSVDSHNILEGIGFMFGDFRIKIVNNRKLGVFRN